MSILNNSNGMAAYGEDGELKFSIGNIMAFPLHIDVASQSMIKTLSGGVILESVRKKNFTEDENKERRKKLFEASLIGIDWDNPSWYSGGKVHNWHNYAPPELQEIWNTFTQDQKKAIAFALDECAGNEQWE